MVDFVHSRLQFKGGFMLASCIPLELQVGVKHLAVIIDERYGLHIQRSNDYQSPKTKRQKHQAYSIFISIFFMKYAIQIYDLPTGSLPTEGPQPPHPGSKP